MAERWRASTACPVCKTRDVVDVWQVLEAKPIGSFSLAGAQMKFSARSSWRYECTNCGATGSAEPKAATEETENPR